MFFPGMKWGCDLHSQGGNGLAEDLLRGGVGWGELSQIASSCLAHLPGPHFPRQAMVTTRVRSLHFLLQLHCPVAGGQLSSSERELALWHPLLLFSAAPAPPLPSNPPSHPTCHSHDNLMLHFSLVASFHLPSTLFCPTHTASHGAKGLGKELLA